MAVSRPGSSAVALFAGTAPAPASALPARKPARKQARGAGRTDLATTARAVLAGLDALGVNAGAIQRAVGVTTADLEPADAVLAPRTVVRIWEEAFRLAPRDELPTEAGLALPMGAFGTVDVLAGTARDVESALREIQKHFGQVAAGYGLEVLAGASGGEVDVVHFGSAPREERDGQAVDEFVIAATVNRLRLGCPDLQVEQIRLTRPLPAAPTRHRALLGGPVVFGCSTAALCLPLDCWTATLRSANPLLQDAMRQVARRLDSASAARPDEFELSIRSRLRSCVLAGKSTAEEVARSFGVSERTMHRRLRALGTSYQEILDRCRETEAERLLTRPGTELAEAALRLGFSGQSAWNRAFRRWKGMSPTAWLGAQQRNGPPRRIPDAARAHPGNASPVNDPGKNGV